jgi:hypothetical protein
MTKAALRDKQLLPTFHGGLIELGAAKLGRRGIVRKIVPRRLFGSYQSRRPNEEGNDEDYFHSLHSFSPKSCVILDRIDYLQPSNNQSERTKKEE